MKIFNLETFVNRDNVGKINCNKYEDPDKSEKEFEIKRRKKEATILLRKTRRRGIGTCSKWGKNSNRSVTKSNIQWGHKTTHTPGLLLPATKQ